MNRRVVLAMCLMALMAPASVAAGQPDGVDPALMQPPLNATFGPWQCWQTGTGITCAGERSLAWQGVETGFVCDGRPVYTTGTDVRSQRRYGDAAGLALRTMQHVDIRETLTLSPDGSGPALAGTAHFEEQFHYLVPGDLASRTDRSSGLDVHVTGPGVGLVIHDVGLKTFDIDDNILLAHGPHPLLADFEGAFAKLCAAFAEMGT
jgi:hypothetical protein